MAWYDMLQNFNQYVPQTQQEQTQTYQPLSVQAPSSDWNMPLRPTNFGGALPEVDNITSIMNELYNPKTTMQDQYNQMINNFPQREDPSKWRRLGAILTGMGSQDPMGASDRFLNYHYYNDLGDWKQKASHVQQAADNERAQNINERQLAYQTAGRTLEERRIKEAERKNLENESLRRQTEERRARSARVMDTLRQNPNLQDRVVNGELVLIDPKPGGAAPIRTGIKGWTDEEKADAAMARAQYNQGQANYRNQNTIDAATTRQQAGAYVPVQVDDPNNPGQKITVRMNTVDGSIAPFEGPLTNPTRIGTPSSGNAPDPNLALGRARTLREKESQMKYPQYFDTKGNLKPTGWFSGPDAATRSKIESYINNGNQGLAPGNTTPFGGGTSPITVNAPNSQSAAPTQAPIRQRNTRTGQTRVSYDGGVTWRNE